VSIAVELIEETWGKKKRLGPWEKVLAEHLVRLFHTPLHSFGQPFIVSFCEDGDLLSQWRAYGGMSGFSLAFSPLDDAASRISRLSIMGLIVSWLTATKDARP
jgi:hypothetical protein